MVDESLRIFDLPRVLHISSFDSTVVPVPRACPLLVLSWLGRCKGIYEAIAGARGEVCTVCLNQPVRPTATMCGHVVSSSKYSIPYHTISSSNVRFRHALFFVSYIESRRSITGTPALYANWLLIAFISRLLVRTKNSDEVLPKVHLSKAHNGTKPGCGV